MDDCNSDHPFEIKEEVKNKSKYMIAKQLIEPKSIVVVGGSDDIHKPGVPCCGICKTGTSKVRFTW